MDDKLNTLNSDPSSLPRLLREGWRDLCAEHLSISTQHSIWRFSRALTPFDPEQGWKLHISATVLKANKVLAAVGPFLMGRRVLFKGPVSLDELSRLNSGIHYGYTQVGKCLTVYPQTTDEAVALAEKLDKLTFGISAPAVPFDLKFGTGCCVYYRYGAFKHMEIGNEDGSHSLGLRDLEGRLVPDLRESLTGKPKWVLDPFRERYPDSDSVSEESPLKTTFRVFKALTQRGKGGVYQAFDLSLPFPRLCILKEGRKDGESSWDGCDGYTRVKNEEYVLRCLSTKGIEVPRVRSSFEVEDNFYLATEFINGITLQGLLKKRERRLSIARVLKYGLQIGNILARIHSAGWVWRDCKPSNLIVGKKDVLRPIDFEGACRINQANPSPWGTNAFVPPESKDFITKSKPADDLYALGVILHHLLWGDFPSEVDERPGRRVRRNVPGVFVELVSGLLHVDPNKRPSASLVARHLRKAHITFGGARSVFRLKDTQCHQKSNF